jgi:hypothetical protein
VIQNRSEEIQCSPVGKMMETLLVGVVVHHQN